MKKTKKKNQLCVNINPLYLFYKKQDIFLQNIGQLYI